MPAKKRVSDADILAAYARCGGVWGAAKELGMCGQSVHERLVKLGANKPANIFTKQDADILLRDYETYAADHRLDDLAKKMGRTKQFICRKAKELGLTDQKRAVPEWMIPNMSASTKEQIKKNGHPRGFLGGNHSTDMRIKMSDRMNERWASMTEEDKDAHAKKCMVGRIENGTYAPERKNTSWKSAWREIGGQRAYFRSAWEANYARYLQFLVEKNEILGWEHEPQVFWFNGIKRGTMTYLPDFRVTENSGEIVYHEVKGWMDSRSATKIKRMAKYHPDVKLVVIDSKAYKTLARQVGFLIQGWE